MADDSNPPSDKRPRLETDYNLCIICPTGGEELVKNPKEASLQKLLECVHTRGLYCDKNFKFCSSRLHEVDSRSLLSLHASYHRRCYQETVNPDDISRAKKRYEQAVFRNSSDILESKIGRPISPSTPVTDKDAVGVRTRSFFEEFNHQLCFFCQTVNTSIPLHEISPFSSGKKTKGCC